MTPDRKHPLPRPATALTCAALTLAACGANDEAAEREAADNLKNQEAATAVVVDAAAGRMVIAGGTSGALHGERTGSTDAFLASYDDQGRRRWIRQWGAGGSDAATGVALDHSGHLYVVGRDFSHETLSAAWLRKYDGEGNLVWAVDGSVAPLDGVVSYYPRAVAADRGRIYLSGYTLQSDGSADAWLVAYTEDGQPAWLQPIGGADDDGAFAVAVDGSGGVYVSGYSDGLPGQTAAGGRDAWVAKYDADGGLLWLRQFGSTRMDVASAVTVNGGGVYVGGYTSGALAAPAGGGGDAWVAKFSTAGEPLWTRQFDLGGNDLAMGIAADGDGVALTGTSDGDGLGRHDAWVTRYGPAGDQRARFRFGTAEEDVAYALAADPSGALYLAGRTEGSLGGPNSGGNDACFGKFTATGQALWLGQLGSPIPGSTDSIAVSARRAAAPRTAVPAPTRYTIAPAATDPAIDQWRDAHYVYLDPGRAPREQLFVHLPGSRGTPERFQQILQLAAANGYRAIGLRYPNQWTVGGLCGAAAHSADDDCFGAVRDEILTGRDSSPLVNVTAANAITNRLAKLLRHLDQTHPRQGWATWLDGDEPKWDAIIVAGTSQGGGQAAYIGKRHRVARVVMLSAPVDHYDDGSAPPWLEAAGATPAERHWGFQHVHDPFWEDNRDNWRKLGLDDFGRCANVAAATPPYGNAHLLCTLIPPSTGVDHGLDAHGSTAADDLTPLLPDGTPVYAQSGVWGYLMGQ